MIGTIHRFGRYVRSYPFSVMAFANIVGDLCYVGFAFDAKGVSVPKLSGALFTIAAHSILLAFGDDHMHKVAAEDSVVSRAIVLMRGMAREAIAFLPKFVRDFIVIKPIALAFAMLAMNGAGLLMDALPRLWVAVSPAMVEQSMVGCLVVIGCAAFITADLTRSQSAADRLVKIGPAAFMAATAASGVLAAETLNPFLICSVLAFVLSSLAGFCTKIAK